MGKKSKIKEEGLEAPETPITKTPETPISQKPKKKKKKKDKSLSPSKRASRRIAAIDSPKSEKQKSEKSLHKKSKKDKKKKKKKRTRPSLISPSEHEHDDTSIHSEEPRIENIGNPGPEEVMVSNFGPMDTPDWTKGDENDMPEDKSMDSADQMMNSNHHPFHESKISMDGSNVIEDKPPIGELVVQTEESDHVSEIGEPVSSMHETANGDDRHSPNDNDICFEDRGHPGTRAMTKVIRDLLNENEGTEYSPAICKLLKRKLKGRRFMIKLRQNEETMWKEATKVEITELIGEWFNEERRREEQGIEDDDSDENSSLQDSGIQSETSMPLAAIMTDPQSIPPSSSKLMVNSSRTPKVSNLGSSGQNGESNGFHHSPGTASGDETAEDLLHSIAEECRNAEEYAHPFKSEDLQKSGRAVEKKLEEILKKMSTLGANKEGEELIEEMRKMDELIERVKYASIGPLLEMVERIYGNLNAYAETCDGTADYSQEPETKSNERLLRSSSHDQSQPPRGSRGSKTKGAMRKERTLNVGLDSEVHVNENLDFNTFNTSNTSSTSKMQASGVSMLSDEDAPVPQGEIHRPQLSDSEDYHEEELEGTGFHDVDEPLKPGSYTETQLKGDEPLKPGSYTETQLKGDEPLKHGSYTETRLKGFDSDAEFHESGELSGDDSNDASMAVQDLGYEENRAEHPGEYTVGLKGSSEDLEFNHGDYEHSYSESVSFVTEEKPSSQVRSYFEYSLGETEEGSQGSQSLKAEEVFERDETEVGNTQSGHVIEISKQDEMSSVGQSQRGGSSLFGFDSDEEDDDEGNYIETEVIEEYEEYTDEEGSASDSASDTSDSVTRHRHEQMMVEQDIPNPRLEQFFDRLQHFFEVRRKVEERADMTDPSHKIRKLKVKVTAGGLRKGTGGFKTEYQQKNGYKDVVKNLDDLYDAAQLTREALIKVLDDLTDEVNGLYNESIELPDLKPRDRAYEKAKEEYGDRRPGPPESWLYDVARASVICKSYKQMADVNKWLGKNVHIVSSKNRFYEPVFNGYRDLLYHISIPYRGKLTHICEIQVHHKDIKALDLQYGLPKHYEFFRSCFAGPWRTQEQILEDLVMMNKYGDVGSMMVKLMKCKDPDQLRLFAGLCREKLDEFDKALELYRRILILQQDKHGHDHESVAHTHLNMGLVLGAKGQIDESLVHMQKALSIQESVFGSDNVDVAALLTEIGRMLSKNGNFEGALIKFEKALEIRESTFGYEHFLVIASLQDIGKAFSDMGDFTAAEVTYRKALKIQEEVLGEVHPDVAATYHMIGTTLCQYGDVSKAMEEFRLALSIRETTLGKNHPMTAESQTDIGIVLCQKGDYEVAEWRHRKALRMRELKGKEDEDCAISLSYLGDVLSRKGEYGGAVKAIKRAQVIREHSLGMDHPITAASYIDLGNVYYKKGDSELALKEFRRARVAREAILGPDHPDTAVAFSCIGNALNLRGDYDAAHKVHSRALKIFADILGENHPLTATGYQNIADTLLLMGEKEEALIQHRKALAVRANVLSKDHPDTALSCSRIGDLLAEKDDLVGALVAHRQALAITVGLCGEDNADSAKAHIHVGLVLAAQGEFDEALDELDQATGVLEALLGESHEETGRAYSLMGSIHSARGEFDDALNMHTHAFDIFKSIHGEDHPKTEAAEVKCRMAEQEEPETEF
jgi:tetratricopeptide (TPR) repeat protein